MLTAGDVGDHSVCLQPTVMLKPQLTDHCRAELNHYNDRNPQSPNPNLDLGDQRSFMKFKLTSVTEEEWYPWISVSRVRWTPQKVSWTSGSSHVSTCETSGTGRTSALLIMLHIQTNTRNPVFKNIRHIKASVQVLYYF